ncbi:MAG: preprotein translocase subunit YajC [Candidatus Binatus sp.]|jgi:preprotein translocase subunit YajC|uniref:preprotein translocase subunit YajC n=1 Tax=Candidatus Binatus sp. TaxID=2811406 RepID=UPI003C73EC3B
MLFEGTAWAQAAAANPADAPSFVQQLMTGPGPIMALVVAVMYFLVFRPQNKKAQEQAKMLSGLKRNDEVVTTGGIIGRIQDVGDKVITLEVAPNVRLKVERSQVASISNYKATAKKEDK